MDRFEARENKTIEELISTAERGVQVELTRDGKVVARVVAEPSAEPKPDSAWLADLKRHHANLPPDWPRTGWQEILREARDESH